MQGSNLQIFAPNADGAATPQRVLTLPSPYHYPTAVAFDAAGDVYVASILSAIFVYPPGASVPSRTISGPLTQLSTPMGLAVDARGSVYVANGSGASISVFAPGANGNAAPARTIAGGATGIQTNALGGIAVDTVGDIYVTVSVNSASGALLKFSPTANGNVAPATTISGPQSGIDGPEGPAIDGAGNLYIVNQSNDSILVFAPGSTSPSRVILSTVINRPGGIAVDGIGTIFVVNQGPSSGGYVSFAPGTNGVGVPVHDVTGSSVPFDQAFGIAVY